jgi:hypothetical protein
VTVKTVIPQSVRYDLVLTALSPISHHDAAKQDDSNRMLFNRQKLLIPAPTEQTRPAQDQIDWICKANPVPADMRPIVESLDFPTFVGTALVRLFIGEYGSRSGGDGEGLFSGAERYGRLEPRVATAASGTSTLRGFWDRLCSQMGVGIHSGVLDTRLVALLGLPAGVRRLVLRALVEHSRTTVLVARSWLSVQKLADPRYAEKAGQATISRSEPDGVMSYAAESIELGSSLAQVVDVPCVSPNSARHQLVRAPAWRHLARRLGLAGHVRPGQGDLPPGVEAIFVNCGNIRAGAKQEGAAFALAAEIRERYPSLDLLGGVTDTFDLGASALRVNAWVVCRENARALGGHAERLPAASVSVFDMVDDVTHTRQQHRGEGQMIYSFETLLAGAQLLVRLSVDPFARSVTHGALVCALREVTKGSVVGGQGARGFGAMDIEIAAVPEGVDSEAAAAEYESYIDLNADALLDGLDTGKMGTTKVVLS